MDRLSRLIQAAAARARLLARAEPARLIGYGITALTALLQFVTANHITDWKLLLPALGAELIRRVVTSPATVESLRETVSILSDDTFDEFLRELTDDDPS